MTILSSLLLISITGIVALISYKYLRVKKCGVCDITKKYPQKYISTKVLRDTISNILSDGYDKVLRRAFVRAKNSYKMVEKNVLEQHSAFTDAVNGKGVHENADESQKGSTSLFLKTVSEHKKQIQEDRK